MASYSPAAVKELLKKLSWSKYKVDSTSVACKTCGRKVDTTTDGSTAGKAGRDQELARLAEHVCFSGRAA